jgi:thiol-disulfide isomerase/thioredoxin
MKKLIIAILTLAVLATACNPPQPEIPTDAQYPEFAFPYEFTATDLYGNTITSETLGEKRAFFVYHWATFCSPCVASMPTLAEFAREYGEHVAFLALQADFDSNQDGARNIMASAEMPDNFIVIDAGGESIRELLSAVRTGFIPTSAIITADDSFPDSITGKIDERHRNILNAVTA